MTTSDIVASFVVLVVFGIVNTICAKYERKVNKEYEEGCKEIDRIIDKLKERI